MIDKFKPFSGDKERQIDQIIEKINEIIEAVNSDPTGEESSDTSDKRFKFIEKKDKTVWLQVRVPKGYYETQLDKVDK